MRNDVDGFYTKEIAEYAMKAMGVDANVDDVMERIFRYTKNGTAPKHAVFNTVMGDRCLTVTLQAPNKVYDILDESGCFAIMYNFDAPECSELGYSFFEKKVLQSDG